MAHSASTTTFLVRVIVAFALTFARLPCSAGADVSQRARLFLHDAPRTCDTPGRRAEPGHGGARVATGHQLVPGRRDGYSKQKMG